LRSSSLMAIRNCNPENKGSDRFLLYFSVGSGENFQCFIRLWKMPLSSQNRLNCFPLCNRQLSSRSHGLQAFVEFQFTKAFLERFPNEINIWASGTPMIRRTVTICQIRAVSLEIGSLLLNAPIKHFAIQEFPSAISKSMENYFMWHGGRTDFHTSLIFLFEITQSTHTAKRLFERS